MEKDISAQAIDRLLPQTQCTRCGYAGCLPYAEAIASGAAEINRCPPGGTETIIALAELTGRPVLALDREVGSEAAPTVAFIDEERCIGCTRCLPPCPVDAIIGARRQMHTVVLSLCNGCELCIAPCPVDCISMVPRAAVPEALREPSAAENRTRYAAHGARLTRRAAERAALLSARKHAVER